MAPKSTDTQGSDTKVSATAGVYWFMTPDSASGSSPPTSSAEPEATMTDSAAESSRSSSSAESGENRTNQDNEAYQKNGADQQNGADDDNEADQDNESEKDKPRLTDREKKTNHISSEQKRRASIRGGFDRLTELVPGIRGQARSEAVVLAKTVEFAREQVLERLSLIRRIEARGGIVPDHSKDAIVDYESKQAKAKKEVEGEREEDKEAEGARKKVQKGERVAEAAGEAIGEGEAEGDGDDEQENAKEAQADKAGCDAVDDNAP